MLMMFLLQPPPPVNANAHGPDPGVSLTALQLINLKFHFIFIENARVVYRF